MANLVEPGTPVYPVGVTSLDLTDDVEGADTGVDPNTGDSNQPHLDLAKRTQFLKDQQDLDAALIANNTNVSSSNTSQISANLGDISVLQANDAQQDVDIAQNQTDIESNESAILGKVSKSGDTMSGILNINDIREATANKGVDIGSSKFTTHNIGQLEKGVVHSAVDLDVTLKTIREINFSFEHASLAAGAKIKIFSHNGANKYADDNFRFNDLDTVIRAIKIEVFGEVNANSTVFPVYGIATLGDVVSPMSPTLGWKMVLTNTQVVTPGNSFINDKNALQSGAFTDDDDSNFHVGMIFIDNQFIYFRNNQATNLIEDIHLGVTIKVEPR